MSQDLIAIARELGHVRETEGENRGKWVSHFQRFCGAIPGDPWCACFVCYCLDVDYEGKSPLVKSAATGFLLSDARHKGLVITQPIVGCLYFYVYETSGVPHHVGIVTGLSPLTGIAGNTSEDGKSSEGTGVFEHEISMVNTVFVRLP